MRKIQDTVQINENILGGSMMGCGYDNTLSPASYSVQGQGPGYIYAILPMTDEMQAPKNACSTDYYIYPGCTVTGHVYNNPKKKVTGTVSRVVKRCDGSVLCLYVLDRSVGRFVSLSPENIELHLNTGK